MTDYEAFIAAIVAEPADDTARLVFADWLEENGDPDRAAFIRHQVGASPWDQEATKLSEDMLRTNRSRWEVAGINGKQSFRRGLVEQIECEAAHWLANCDRISTITPLAHVDLTTRPVLREALAHTDGRQLVVSIVDDLQLRLLDGRAILAEVNQKLARESDFRHAEDEWLLATLRLRWSGISFGFSQPVDRPGVASFATQTCEACDGAGEYEDPNSRQGFMNPCRHCNYRGVVIAAGAVEEWYENRVRELVTSAEAFRSVAII